jgi:hypothetical protein
VITLFPKRRKVVPAFLDRAIRLKFDDKEEKKLLNVGWQLAQTSLDLSFDSYIIALHGNNITTR